MRCWVHGIGSPDSVFSWDSITQGWIAVGTCCATTPCWWLYKLHVVERNLDDQECTCWSLAPVMPLAGSPGTAARCSSLIDTVTPTAGWLLSGAGRCCECWDACSSNKPSILTGLISDCISAVKSLPSDTTAIPRLWSPEHRWIWKQEVHKWVTSSATVTTIILAQCSAALKMQHNKPRCKFQKICVCDL